MVEKFNNRISFIIFLVLKFNIMISVTTKAYLQENQIMNFRIPHNLHLKTGEYEIVIVINDVPLKETKKRKLSFSQHNYCFENPSSTFSRADIYGDFGR